MELFFDLVVVVAVAQLTHRLIAHGDQPGAFDFLALGVLFLAVWLVWTSYTLYANVADETRYLPSMLAGMAGIALMAAAIPEATEERANWFAGAYVVARVLALRSWGHSGKVLPSWPAARAGVGVVPWVISLWVDQPAQLVLWLFGLTVDLLLGAAGGDQIADRLGVRGRRRPQQGRPAPLAVRIRAEHLSERLGLFLIIALGEAVARVVSEAAEAPWDPSLGAAAAAGFVLLVGLWWLIFRHGFARAAGLAPSALLPAHFVVTAAVTVVAAGLGLLAAAPGEHPAGAVRWLAAGGLAAFLAVDLALATKPRARPFGVLPVAVLLLVAGLGWLLPAWVLARIAVGVTLAHIVYVSRVGAGEDQVGTGASSVA